MTRAITSQSGTSAPPVAATPTPAPAPSTPAPAPAPSAPTAAPAAAPFVAPAVRRINPLFDPDTGTIVTKRDFTKTESKPADDAIDFEDLERDTPAAPAAPAAPTTPAAAAAPKAQAAAPSAPEEPAAPESPFALAATPLTEESKGRDYAEFPPELQALAKKLPNKLYNHFTETFARFKSDISERDAKIKSLTKDVEDASGKLISDHPESYVLDPEYRQTVNSYGRAQLESTHYTEQLALIDQGEPWTYIEGYSQSGDPIYKEVPASADGKVDYRAKAAITQTLQQLAAKQQGYQALATNIRNTYTNAANEVANHYKEAQTRLFPNLDVDKLTDEGEKQVYKYAIEALPRVERSRPSARMLGMAAIVVKRMASQYQQALERAERAERLLKNSTAASPVRATPAPVAADAGSMINFDELERS